MLKSRMKKMMAMVIPIMIIGTSTPLTGITTYATEATGTTAVATNTATGTTAVATDTATGTTAGAGTATTSTAGVAIGTTTISTSTATSTLVTTYTDSQGVNYNLDNTKKTASVSGVNSKDIKTVEIPEEVNANGQTYSVTSIDWYAFKGCTGLTNITIPNSVTDIGSYAFYGCTGLTNITIPNSVTGIGYYEFTGCTGLTNITIPSSVTKICMYAFKGCIGLTSIDVDANNKNYSSEDGVLFNKDKTELIKYPAGNKQSSYTIPESVISVDYIGLSMEEIAVYNSFDNPFEGCVSLTSIDVDANNKNYSSEDGVLFNKNKTELIQYPAGNKQSSYTIPDSVIGIREKAFWDCTGLNSITIPDSVTSIDDNVVFDPYNSEFEGCISLASIDVDSNNKNYSSEGGVLFNKDKTELIKYPEGNKQSSYTIPNSVKDTYWNAFKGCIGLTGITIPDSVSYIGYFTFSGCTGLTSVTIPNSVTSIGMEAFSGCTGLTSITIPNSITSIGQGAFEGCTGLTSITIPNSVTCIGTTPADRCNYVNSNLILHTVGISDINFKTEDGVSFYRTLSTGTDTPADATSTTTVATNTEATVTQTSTNTVATDTTTVATDTTTVATDTTTVATDTTTVATNTETVGTTTTTSATTSQSTGTATGTNTTQSSKTGDVSVLPVIAMMAIGAIGIRKGKNR